MKRLFLLIAILSCTVSLLAQDAKTVFLVRHAEKVSNAKDALLSDIGHKRAACLAGVLADSNVQDIIATDVKRTQQTAQPLAERLQKKIAVVPASDINGIVTQIRKAQGNTLVVGHSDTLPDIIHQLTGKSVTIGTNAYDDLFIVSFDPNPAAPVLLHYCSQIQSGPQPPTMLR